MSTVDRSSPAVIRHRGGWPVPAGRFGVVGLTVTALALCAAAGTTLGLAVGDSAAPPPTARWHFGCCVRPVEAAVVADPLAALPPPSEVRIPRVDIRSALVGLDLDSKGELEAPVDFAKAGWYEQGTRPGEPGPAVIAGHVDSYRGPAVFFRLRELRPGDTIEVRRGGQWLPFRVVATGHYPKDKFPTSRVYGATPGAELRLITCGGEFDRDKRSYRDNVVVYAVDARVPELPRTKGHGPTQWQ
ncbi:class F sortase [Asanoa ishikariensis]|uniref:class F sortase n=1 Tax=Asanoa ishikariensis TaxID=137265 RepID=UPI001A3F8539|nr:class F sortase [Asanoa ishikariensis]GIF68132.1 class F sortase [Asanoa ishikariensis]